MVLVYKLIYNIINITLVQVISTRLHVCVMYYDGLLRRYSRTTLQVNIWQQTTYDHVYVDICIDIHILWPSWLTCISLIRKYNRYYGSTIWTYHIYILASAFKGLRLYRSNVSPALMSALCKWIYAMKTSSNGSIFRVTGHLCGGFTGHWWLPCTKVSDAELWCFLWSAPE